jgi:hypothetical protein
VIRRLPCDDPKHGQSANRGRLRTLANKDEEGNGAPNRKKMRTSMSLKSLDKKSNPSTFL